MKREKEVAKYKAQQRKRIGRLKTAADVRKYIAKVIKRCEREGESNENYKLVMMASMLLKAVESAELEKKIEELERRLNNESQRED